MNDDACFDDLLAAFYDEKRKVWVFPGDDPDEKVQPVVGPPPTGSSMSQAAERLSQNQPDDPLAAIMGPPKRRPPSSVSCAAGGPPPPFTIFKPTPAAASPEPIKIHGDKTVDE